MRLLFTKRGFSPIGGSESLAYQFATRLEARNKNLVPVLTGQSVIEGQGAGGELHRGRRIFMEEAMPFRQCPDICGGALGVGEEVISATGRPLSVRLRTLIGPAGKHRVKAGPVGLGLPERAGVPLQVKLAESKRAPSGENLGENRKPGLVSSLRGSLPSDLARKREVPLVKSTCRPSGEKVPFVGGYVSHAARGPSR